MKKKTTTEPVAVASTALLDALQVVNAGVLRVLKERQNELKKRISSVNRNNTPCLYQELRARIIEVSLLRRRIKKQCSFPI